MKIAISGSMSSAHQMLDIKKCLLKLGHAVILPKDTEKLAEKNSTEQDPYESTQNKIERDLIRDYYQEIKKSDALLVVNIDKNGIPNYIGGNSFLEMGFAHILHKPIFLFNNIPQMPYSAEILAMQPVILDNDLTKIIF